MVNFALPVYKKVTGYGNSLFNDSGSCHSFICSELEKVNSLREIIQGKIKHVISWFKISFCNRPQRSFHFIKKQGFAPSMFLRNSSPTINCRKNQERTTRCLM